MEKNSIEKLPVYNGNVSHNEFHEDSNSNKSQETPVSRTLVFYVNGKEVRWQIYFYSNQYYNIIHLFQIYSLIQIDTLTKFFF